MDMRVHLNSALAMQRRVAQRKVETKWSDSPPVVIGWETTLRCNMDCRHCGSTAGPARQDELSTSDALALCQQIIDLRVERVCLTGGETLLRQDWRQIVDRLLAGGIGVGILTNGWTLTPRGIAEFAQYRGQPVYVSLSLDGTPEVHDHIRNISGSFARAFAGGQALIAAGIPVAVITTVNHANLEALVPLRELLMGQLKPYCWQIQTTSAFGRARENAECSLSHAEYVELVCRVCETRRVCAKAGINVVAGDCLGYLSSLESGLRNVPWDGCHAGKRVLGIQSNGNVKGCLSIIDDGYIEGNVLQEGLASIWRRGDAFAYTRGFKPAMLGGLCAGCDVGATCRGGCTASAISFNGRPHTAPYCMRVFENALLPTVQPEPRKLRSTQTKRARPATSEER